MPATEPVDYLDADGLEEAARAVLSPAVHDFFAGGAGDESTVAANRAAWQAMRVRPRVLRGGLLPETSVSVLGGRLAVPLAVAPMGYQRLADPEGEVATARAAARTGVAMTLSTYATSSLEEVAAAAPDAVRWFQAYVLTDRDATAELLHRAATSGYGGIVLTVDATAPGDRRRDRRHGFVLPHEGPLELPHLGAGDLDAAYSTRLEQHLTPDVVGWVREAGGLPIAVKGVLHPDDARAAVDAGASAVVVSNHGGRQSDAALASADALPAVVAAVGDRAEVLVDGGVRSGSDVVRALALGARAVLVGRPVLWALALGGEQGVAALLAGLTEGTLRCLQACGATSVDDLDPGVLHRIERRC
jgi:4-hydroxymandelate oxidase